MDNNTKTTILCIVIIGIAIIGVWLYRKYFKKPKVNNLVMITGGVKSGKSTYAIWLTIKQWKHNHRVWKIRKIFQKILHREISEEPLLYSNIPLNMKYVPVTEELLERKKRFNYGSCIYLGEVSLVSNSMNFEDKELNERQLLFYKLIAHETKGGMVVLDTQSIQDTHYSIKRSISEYFYIHHTMKIPFFLLMYVREDRYSEDGTAVSTYDKDTEESLKPVLVPKRVWKKFDCYCYSAMTDELERENKEIKPIGLKARSIVSFNKYKYLYNKDDGNNNNDITSNNNNDNNNHSNKNSVKKYKRRYWK